MTRICNFPISKTKRCKQPMADNKPNCGRHKTELSAEQLGEQPTAYRKDNALHVWTGEPDGLYCIIHSDPAYQALCQLAGEVPPCCLRKDITWKDEHGKRHREDGPAWIMANGTQIWYWHGEEHRDDGPAWIWLGGSQCWCQRGKRHRDNGPAVISPDGYQAWYQHGKRHRDDGPAWVEADGTQQWYQHGKLHRDDGPAKIDPDGTQEWYWYGEEHREDGPAVIWEDGRQEWYWHGKRVTEQEHAKLRTQSEGV